MQEGVGVLSVTKWSLQPLPDMSDKQFRQWQGLLEDRTGMRLTEQRKSFLRTSLGMRMREIGCADYDDYYQQIQDGVGGQVEWTTLVDRLTVQETCFFRHHDSYALAQKYVQQRVDEKSIKKPLELWSVGCSTGEEPYSLAMLTAETLAGSELKDNYYGVTATDISLPVLERAKEAIYHARKLGMVEFDLQQKYFNKLSDDKYQVSDELKSRTCFANVNVLDLNKVPFKDVDIIFCQNVLIYFERWRRNKIISSLAERLAPGGILVLGVGEITGWSHPDLERVADDKTLSYRRRP